MGRRNGAPPHPPSVPRPRGHCAPRGHQGARGHEGVQGCHKAAFLITGFSWFSCSPPCHSPQRSERAARAGEGGRREEIEQLEGQPEGQMDVDQQSESKGLGAERALKRELRSYRSAGITEAAPG